jgi:hypothetical protein
MCRSEQVQPSKRKNLRSPRESIVVGNPLENDMNRPILIACLCAAAVASCGRTVVREERVVEKQPVVTRETVVERPAETIVATAPSCSLGAAVYSSGTLSCQAGYQYVCRDGAWNRIPGSSC